MSWDSRDNAGYAGDYEQDREESEESVAWVAEAGMADPCTPLVEEIEALEEQVALLEEGLPHAPGMERAALFKEVAGYRRELDARRHALRRCRGERG